MIRYLGAALVAGLLAAPAVAETRPNLVPAHDVAVSYRLSGVPAASSAHVAVGQGGQRLRIEADGLPGIVLVNRTASQILVLMTGQPFYLAMPVPDVLQPLMIGATPASNTTRLAFTRTGTAIIASRLCTDWLVRQGGRHATLCLTNDGVLLRGITAGDKGHDMRIEAISVSDAPQPDQLFVPPAGYHRLGLP